MTIKKFPTPLTSISQVLPKTVWNNIPVSVHNEFVSPYYEKLTDIFNNCIRSRTFPEIF